MVMIRAVRAFAQPAHSGARGLRSHRPRSLLVSFVGLSLISLFRVQWTQPFFMDIDPDGIPVGTGRYLAQIEFDGVERFMNVTVVSNILQKTVHRANHPAFASDIMRRPRVAAGVFDGNQDSVTNLVFTGGGLRPLYQSGLTLGASGLAPRSSASFCRQGSSA